MANKLKRERTSLRLPDTMLAMIDAHKGYSTRTAVIEAALRELIYDMQHDVYHNDFLSSLRKQVLTRTQTTQINIRLPAMYLEYLRFNQYNINACIKYAVTTYVH